MFDNVGPEKEVSGDLGEISEYLNAGQQKEQKHDEDVLHCRKTRKTTAKCRAELFISIQF